MKSALLKLIIGLVLLTVLIMTSKLESNLVEAQEPCYPPLSLARTNGASWPRGTNVTVFIDPDGFSALENVAIRDAFINWQNSNRSRGNNSNVTFTFVSGAPAPGELNTFDVHRGAANGLGHTNIAFTGDLTTAGNRTTSAITIIPSGVNFAYGPDLTSVMAHEIGHTVGLDDCYPDCNGRSVMGLAGACQVGASGQPPAAF